MTESIALAAIWNGTWPANAADEPSPEPMAGTIVIHQEQIAQLRPGDTAEERPPARPALDATGCTVLPGFIDVHVHGGAGFDTMDATPEALAAMARFFVRHGVTGFYPTTVTAEHGATLKAVRNAAAMQDVPRGARILGVHLEGPYISPHFPGAQPAGFIREPNLAEFEELTATGPVRLITLAPEQPGADQLIQAALDKNIRVVLGHTAATYEQAKAAIRSGVSQATHTFNAMTGLHHRRPGALGAVLSEDDIYGQLIPDNIHVHPAAMKILARCKGVARTILITDAIRAAGLPPGEYELGGQAVTVRDGACRLASGTLAGSIVTMDRALANFTAATGLSLAETWPASSRTPAEAMGLHGEIGSIAPGFRADLALLDEQLQVAATIVGGRVAFLRDEWRLQT